MATDKGQERVQAILRMLEKQDKPKTKPAKKPSASSGQKKKKSGTKSTIGKAKKNIKSYRQRLEDI